jgi:hypothetical protein
MTAFSRFQNLNVADRADQASSAAPHSTPTARVHVALDNLGSEPDSNHSEDWDSQFPEISMDEWEEFEWLVSQHAPEHDLEHSPECVLEHGPDGPNRSPEHGRDRGLRHGPEHVLEHVPERVPECILEHDPTRVSEVSEVFDNGPAAVESGATSRRVF